MHANITEQLTEVAKLRREPATEVIAEAVEIGMSKLYQECVLNEYLKKRMSRNKAIQLAGLEAVRLAEEQYKTAKKDIAWGLGNG